MRGGMTGIEGGIQQLTKGRVAAQQRVDQQVVVGVIPMVRRRREDGIQAEGVDPQVDEVVEVLDDAQQVATLEAVSRRRVSPRLESAGLLDTPARQPERRRRPRTSR